jgi:exodeoxyribonuclease V gamma subunit
LNKDNIDLFTKISRFETHFWHYGAMSELNGFYLHHSNQLERLAYTLGKNMAESQTSNILQADTVLIPQPSMRRWLQKSLAEQFGIAANIDFLPPGSFINRQLEAWLPKQLPLLTPEILRWRLFALLQDQVLMRESVFLGLSHFMQTGESQLRAWQLAGELSQAYEKYQAWRKNWLIDWHHNCDEHDWQAKLWFLASQDHSFRAQAFQRYFKSFDNSNIEKPVELPERLFVFACQSISPDVLRVIRSFARWSQVHFYLHNPCFAYWGDVQKPKTAEELIAIQGDNALLNQWGRAGRDFVASLISEQSPYDKTDDADYIAPQSESPSLLHQIQTDFLYRREPIATFPTFTNQLKDDSLQIHSCHTPLREIQVLRAQLLALFEKNPELNARDVVVMTPHLDRYAPYIESVFNQQDGIYPALPYTLSDQTLFAESKLAKLFFRLLALAQNRFTSNEGFELISHVFVAKHYGLQKIDLERIHYWLEQASVRWGIDSKHRQNIDGIAQQQFTWQQGLQRLLLGYASHQSQHIGELAPVLSPIGQDQDLLDTLIEFTDFVDRTEKLLNRTMSASDWQTTLNELLQKFVAVDELEDNELESYNRLNEKINQLPLLVTSCQPINDFGLTMICDYLNDEGEQRLSQAWLSGRITICKMVPMRLIPFKVICILGMNENEFPRADQSAAINRLMADNTLKLIGDRNNREDDRFLFLQLLSASQQHFYLSFIGKSVKDNSEISPSILISELLQSISRYFPNSRECAEQFIITHPLHVFETNQRYDHRLSTLRKVQQLPVRHELPLFAPVFKQQQDCIIPLGNIQWNHFIRFWFKPIPQLAATLGIRLPKHEFLLEETEPYGQLRGLAGYQLEQSILNNSTKHSPQSNNEFIKQLQAEGILAAGRLGVSTYNYHAEKLSSAITLLRSQLIPEKILPIDLQLHHLHLQGELIQNYSCGLVFIHAGKSMGAKQHIHSGLNALIAKACDFQLDCFDLSKDQLKIRPMSFTVQQARHALSQLADLYIQGQQQILCFDARISFDFYQAYLKNTAIDVQQWLLELQSKESEDFAPSFDNSLEFLTYGQGFIYELALKNPHQFESLAKHIFGIIMGSNVDE